MISIRKLVNALAAACVATACSAPAPTDSLFPLEAGHRWQYDLRTDWENNAMEHETRVITTEGKTQLPGGNEAWRRRSADGVDWYLRADASGTYRVAVKNDLAEAPTPDAQPRFVLKAPLAAGTTWQHNTAPYLLRRRADFPPEIRHSHPAVPMVYTIAAVDESINVRAGAFKRCVRVQGLGAVRLFADPVAGWRDVPLKTTEWYCPGPGLVKLVREEAVSSAFLLGGTLTMELVDWQ